MSDNMIEFSRHEIKNYLVNRSYLHNQSKNISDVLNHYSCLQVDPLSVVAKNQELVLFNRVEQFKPDDLNDYIYTKRQGFEYWLQLYSIVPLESFPYLTARMRIKNSWQEDYYNKHRREIDITLEFISKNGPTSSKDLSHIPKVKGIFSWTGKDTRTGLLAYLWDTGQIMISYRKKNQKFYDLTENTIPVEIINKKITTRKSIEFILRQSFKYLGIVRIPYSNRCGYAIRTELLKVFKKMLIQKQILNLTIDGKKSRYYILRDQIEDIKKLGLQNLHKELNILPPLDPLVIDRKILCDIFNFNYTWEAYVPAINRKFGHYGMPVLFQGNFIGQILLEKDKINKRFKIKNVDLKTNNTEVKKLLNLQIDQLSLCFLN